jgi:uncharacterized protein
VSGVRALCVSIHDVAPRTFGACQRIAQAVREVDPACPLTLLVVPRYHGDDSLPPEFLSWLESRRARGDELALHGYTHLDDGEPPRGVQERLRRQTYTAGEGEFAALAREEAAKRIECGRRWFAQHGWTPSGFVAPAWLLSRGAWQALEEAGFQYTTTLTRFHALNPRASIRAPSIVYSTRSAVRRRASCVWNRVLLTTASHSPLVRVGFHPADAQYSSVMQHGLELLAQLLRTRTALTKTAYVRHVR